MDMPSSAKPASLSRTTMVELMIPAYANFGGKIHGGILLGLMDKVAYACATRHARAYCVTVSADNVEFRKPVEVGDLVSLRASINYVGHTSMLVGIHIDAEHMSTGEVRHTNTCYFTMVAKDDDHEPAEVPGLLLETREDVRRYLEAIKRRALKKRYQVDLDNERSSMLLESELHLLEGERCELADGALTR
jgi:acyl-CoA hydrolase